MNKSKIYSLLNAISSMDSPFIVSILNDCNFFSKEEKSIVVKKLFITFSKLKKSGDTKLMYYSGKCFSKDLEFVYRQGVAFVGNVSQKYFALFFEIKGDELTLIYDVPKFKFNDSEIKVNEHLKTGIPFNINSIYRESLNVKMDEDTSFMYCHLAYDEFEQNTAFVIDGEFISSWVSKYKNIFKSLNYTIYDETPLGDIWSIINDIRSLNIGLELKMEVYRAVVRYNQISKDNESQLLYWLVQHEELWNKLYWCYITLGDITISPLPEFFIIYDCDFKFKTSDFKYLIHFHSIYDEPYSQMLEKYNTFQDNEQSEYLDYCLKNNKRDFLKAFSLKFHLDRANYKFIK